MFNPLPLEIPKTIQMLSQVRPQSKKASTNDKGIILKFSEIIKLRGRRTIWTTLLTLRQPLIATLLEKISNLKFLMRLRKEESKETQKIQESFKRQ